MSKSKVAKTVKPEIIHEHQHRGWRKPASAALFIVCVILAICLSALNGPKILPQARAQTTQPTTLPVTAAPLPDNWQQLSLSDLATAVRYFSQQLPPPTGFRNQRKQVAQFVWSNYLLDDQHFQPAYSSNPDAVLELIMHGIGAFTPAQTTSVSFRVTTIASNANETTALDYRGIVLLTEDVARIGADHLIAQHAAANWVNGSNQLGKLTRSQLLSLARRLQVVDKDDCPCTTTAMQAVQNAASNLLGPQQYPAFVSAVAAQKAAMNGPVQPAQIQFGRLQGELAFAQQQLSQTQTQGRSTADVQSLQSVVNDLQNQVVAAAPTTQPAN